MESRAVGAIFVLSFLSFGLYSSSFWAEFVYDDSRAILTNQDLRPQTPWTQIFTNDYWGTSMGHSGSHKSYRPLTVATFRLNYIFGELQPFGYHLVNVVLHCLVTVQVWFLARKFLKRSTSLFSGLLFAVHPIHTEAVSGVVGRADILATLFFLGALSAYQKHMNTRNHCDENRQKLWLIITVALSAASLLSKEHGVTVLAVCLIWDLILRNRFSLKNLIQMKFFKQENFKSSRNSIATLIVFGSFCVLFRLWIMNFEPPHFSPADNPTAHCDCAFTRLATFLYLTAFNAKLLLFPELLSFDWSMDTIPQITSLFDSRNWVTVAVFGTVSLLAIKLLESLTEYSNHKDVQEPKTAFRRSPSPKFDINANRIDFGKKSVHFCTNSTQNCTISKCCSAVASTVSVKNGYKLKFKGANLNLKPEFAYDTKNDAAFLGLAIMVLTFLPATNLFAYVGFVVAERVLYLPSVGFCLLVSAGLEKVDYLAIKRRKLVKYALKFGTVIVLVSLACKTLARNLDWLNEEALYRSGISTNPAKAYSNLGNVLSRQKRYSEAEMSYNLALKHRANMADTHYNLGTLLQETGRFDQAVLAYKNAIECRSRLAVAHLNLGLTLWTLKRTQEAEMRFQECSELSVEGLKDPKSHENAKLSCLYNLGRLLTEQGKYTEAVSVYKTAIRRLTPDYPSTHSLYNMMGEAYGKLGELLEAETCFKRSLAIKTDHIPAHLTYGHLLSRKGLPEDAISWFKKAVSLAPKDPSVWYHFGQFYQQTEEFRKALSVYETAYELDKRNFDVVFALANVFRELGENERAEKFYESAVGLNPTSANARMNYGAVLHLNKKYDHAEVQYLKSLELSPGDKVTQDNLKKLRRILNKNLGAK